jgi:hypothetical protein
MTMAIIERREAPSRDELLADIRRHGRGRCFEEMLGPAPAPGDAEELQEFLAFLEEQRRQSARYPGDREPGK